MVNLTAMQVTIRRPYTFRIIKPVLEVSDQEQSFVVSAEEVVLGPFERRILSAEIITQEPNLFHFRIVMEYSCSMKSNSVFVSEDTITSVGEDGINFLALRNQGKELRNKL